jgi:hypothetical protein
MAKTALSVDELFALSDALGTELFLFDNGKIEGECSRSVVIGELNLKMNMTPKVVRSKIEWKKRKGGVEPIILLLVHVIGDLFVFLANDRTSGEIICMLINADMVPHYPGETTSQGVTLMFEEHQKKSVANIMKEFLPYSVAEFMRDQYDTDWKEAA